MEQKKLFFFFLNHNNITKTKMKMKTEYTKWQYTYIKLFLPFL